MKTKPLCETWITVAMAAKIIGCSPATVRLMIAEGKIAAERVGTFTLVCRTSLENVEARPIGRPRSIVG